MVVASVVGGLAAACAAYAVHHLRAPAGYMPVREVAILSHARQERFPVVVMGDSIVDLADIPTLCGERVLNAGIAGARVGDLLRFAPRLLAATHPQLVVIAVGTNDANRDYPTDPARFDSEYRLLIQMVKRSGAAVAVADVEPVGALQHFTDANDFSPARIAQINTQVSGLGVPVIPLSESMARPGDPLPDAFTDDGVHPNAAGYVRWRRAVSTACSLAQGSLA